MQGDQSAAVEVEVKRRKKSRARRVTRPSVPPDVPEWKSARTAFARIELSSHRLGLFEGVSIQAEN